MLMLSVRTCGQVCTCRSEEVDVIHAEDEASLFIVGPLGERLQRENLPPRETTRWVVRRKAEVVAAVNSGLLSVREACDRYSLSLEELASWQRSVDREGMLGLTRRSVQQHRRSR